LDISHRLAERDNEAHSWFGGRNAAVPKGGFQQLGQPEGLSLEFGHFRIGRGIDLPFFVGGFVGNFVGIKVVPEA